MKKSNESDRNVTTRPDCQLVSMTEEQAEKYDRLTKNDGMRYAKAVPEGIEIDGDAYKSVTGVILPDWSLYHYHWIARKKETFSDADPAEIAELGLKQGADFRLNTGKGGVVKFSLPVSSYIPFSAYAASLRRKGLMLENVITRVGSEIKVFSAGPCSIFSFEVVGMADQMVVDAEVVDQAVAQSTATTAPAAWA